MPYIILLAIVIFLVIYLKMEVSKNYTKMKVWISRYRKQVIAALGVIGYHYINRCVCHNLFLP